MKPWLLVAPAVAGMMVLVCGCGSDKTDDVVGGPTHDASTVRAVSVNGVVTPKDAGGVESFLFVRDQDGNGLEVFAGEVRIEESPDGTNWQAVTVSVAGGVKEALPVAASLTMDYSGSMSNVQAVVGMENGIQTFIDRMGAGDTAEIIKFSTKVRMLQRFTSDKDALRNAVAADFPDAWGMTALYDSMQRALADTAEQGAPRAVVALTDGRENASATDRPAMIAYAQTESIPVFTVGLGSNVHADDLTDVSENTGGSFYPVSDSAGLADAYAKISGVLQKAVRCQWGSAFASGSVQCRVTVTYNTPTIVYETSRTFVYTR